MIVTYPVCFYPGEKKGFCAIVPDLPGCVTGGNTMDESLFMAQEAIEGWLYTSIRDGDEIPEPTEFTKIKADEYPNGFVSLVRADVDAYIEKYHKKSVHKNCTVPAWLNSLAEKKGLNFSYALQEGLKQQLNLA
jgi:predicted RNase H-like HicB family nuclease